MFSKSHLSKILSFLVVLTFIVFSLGTEASSQLKERTLKRSAWRNEPIKIYKIKNLKKELALGTKFSDEDDWLKGLTIRVKNISNKPIKFIELELHFLPPGGSDAEAVPVFPLIYGQVSSPVEEEAQAPKMIMPGEFGELSLSDSDYESLVQLLGNTDARAVDVILRQVYFSDGTKWEAEQYLQQVRNDARQWKELGGTTVRQSGSASEVNNPDVSWSDRVFF